MNIRWLRHARVGMVALALVAGGLAAWGAHRHLGAVAHALAEEARQPMRAAVVAADDLGAGAVVDADTAAVREIPVAWLPRDAVLPEDFGAAEGARLARALPRGEVLLWSHLAAARQQSFSSQLAAGRRAVTIAVDEINSLSGMLEPGDVIDLYVSFEHEGRRVTAPLLANVRVLATGRQHDGLADGAERGFATLTLDAAPEDAVRLVAARQQGSIAAMLRHPGDASPAASSRAGDLARLLGLEAPPAKPAPGVPVVFGDRGPASIPGLGETVSSEAARAAHAAFLEREGARGDAVPSTSGASWHGIDAHYEEAR